VRNYIKKTSGLKYTVEDVKKAVAVMKKENKTYKQISEKYNISITVIFNIIKGRQSRFLCTKNGRLPALPMNVENYIEKCLIARAQMGQPCDKAEFNELVRDCCYK